MWMRASEEQLKTGVHAIKLENHEGLWIEKPDLFSKYLRRPSSVEDICLAQFAKMYKGSVARKDDSEGDGDIEEDVEDNREDENPELTREDRFHYIMTYRDIGSKGKPLPEQIKLNDPSPGERVTMRRRLFPAALRFHKVKQDNDHKRYMLSEVMLYCPLRDEINPEQAEELFNEEYNGRRKIDIVKSQVMEHLESVTEARYHVEELAREGKLDLDYIGEMIDASGVQENDDCGLEGKDEHEDFLYCNPDEIKKCEEQKIKTVFKKIVLPTTDELRRKTESLDEF